MAYKKSRGRLLGDLFGKASIFTRQSDDSIKIDTDSSGVVSSSTTVANTAFQSALANTNAWIASVSSASGSADFTQLVNYTLSNTTPSVSVNPSSNGALWVDSTTGAMYICTNNTTGNNVWTVTSSLATTIEPTPPLSFQGSNYGYSSGGFDSTSALNVIDKFPFATDANATDVGNITVARRLVAGQSSTDYGYTSGGQWPQNRNEIDKFPFATDANSTNVGDVTVTRRGPAGQSSSEYGYTSGGYAPTYTNVIDKFPFATDANATDVGDLTVARQGSAGQSSTGYGYTSGGNPTPSRTVIDKFPFASDGNATDVGDLTVSKYYLAGQSSSEYGYSTNAAGMDKFPFASDGNATDVGDLTVARSGLAGQSSIDYGYSSGGGPPQHNEIDKFPFAADANATDVGNLSVARYYSAGQQY